MGTIGILVDPGVFRGIRSGRTGSENLRLYNKAAAKHGLKILYMSLDRISPSFRSAFGYKRVKGKYVSGNYPIPKVIHNRTLSFSARSRMRLRRLKRIRRVFNGQNRYSKYRIHKLLRGVFPSHLPVTVPFSRAHLREMMSRFGSLYIKPRSSSVGSGIIRISRKKSGKWQVRLPNASLVADAKKTVSIVMRYVRKRKYIIQQTIPLATYNGRPYDIRVSVQRGASGFWQVTGMYGKVARKGSHVTNVARRGTAKPCDVLLRHSFADPMRVAANLQHVSLSIARYLGRRLDNLADIGLDMGVDAAGHPYFIEMNGRDQRYGFRKAGMPGAFYRVYETPLLYAKYLLRRTKRG